MENYKQVLALVTVVVLASGCSPDPETESSTGASVISVENFEAIPNPATAGRTVNFNMELENSGDNDARNVVARLFGPAGLSPDSTGPKTWRNSDEGRISETDRTMTFGNLRAAQENNPAIPKAQSVSLTAPRRDRDVSYTFYSKIFYQYQTQATSDFSLVANERFQDEGMTQSETTLDSGTGPIELDIRGRTPIRFFRDGENPGRVREQVCVRVVNEGSGTPFINAKVSGEREYNVEDRDRNKVLLSIQDIGNVNFEPQGDPDRQNDRYVVELVSGNEGFQCFDMDAQVSPSTEEININTEITAEYGYVKETETTVEVEGRRQYETNPRDRETNSDELENSDNYDWVGEKDATYTVAEGSTDSEKCMDLKQRAESGQIAERQFTDNCEVVN
jgi:hypothetical protein